MSLLFFLHSLSQPARLASPAFTRRSMFQKVAGMLFAPIAQPMRQRVRRDVLARRRHPDGCHFQLRAL